MHHREFPNYSPSLKCLNDFSSENFALLTSHEAPLRIDNDLKIIPLQPLGLIEDLPSGMRIMRHLSLDASSTDWPGSPMKIILSKPSGVKLSIAEDTPILAPRLRALSFYRDRTLQTPIRDSARFFSVAGQEISPTRKHIAHRGDKPSMRFLGSLGLTEISASVR